MAENDHWSLSNIVDEEYFGPNFYSHNKIFNLSDENEAQMATNIHWYHYKADYLYFSKP